MIVRSRRPLKPGETIPLAKSVSPLLVPPIFLSFLLALTLSTLWVFQPREALAANLVVNSVADAVDQDPGNGICDTGNGSCTLRAAVMEANALAGADTIVLPAGIYILAIAATKHAGAAEGDLDIIDELTITGAGAAATIVDGGGIDRVFKLLPEATVEISGVTVRNGNSIGNGGGILNEEGTLVLLHNPA